MGNFSITQNWLSIILMKVHVILNIFTTGTMSPTATVWPEQGFLNLTSNSRQNLKMHFSSQIFILIYCWFRWSQIISNRIIFPWLITFSSCPFEWKKRIPHKIFFLKYLKTGPEKSSLYYALINCINTNFHITMYLAWVLLSFRRNSGFFFKLFQNLLICKRIIKNTVLFTQFQGVNN
jgi:hypothetical protein